MPKSIECIKSFKMLFLSCSTWLHLSLITYSLISVFAALPNSEENAIIALCTQYHMHNKQKLCWDIDWILVPPLRILATSTTVYFGKCRKWLGFWNTLQKGVCAGYRKLTKNKVVMQPQTDRASAFVVDPVKFSSHDHHVKFGYFFLISSARM